MCFRFHENHLLFALKEVKDFMVRRARQGVEACGRIFPRSKDRILIATSLRGILAISLIISAGLFISYFFLSVSPQKTPLPSTPEKSAVEKKGERFDPAAGNSSEKDYAPLYVSVESVRSMLKRKQDILLIDVRSRDAFEEFRLPGSIRIPLYALKTKAFLKDKPLVLVSEGYPNHELERTGRELRVAGFARLSILNGGLRYWMQKNGPIEGDAFASHEVSRISPIAFFPQKDSGEWLVITVSPSAAAPARQPIPGALHLPWEGNPSRFASALKAITDNMVKSPLLCLLVCDERGDQYESIERAVEQAKIGKVFYLKGGMESYQAFLEQQELLRQPRKEEVKRCATCP
jgi:rhodanese-related sulfurtransferase